MKLEIKISIQEGSTEHYNLKLYTYKETIETKIDKENLRYLIGKMDNVVIS
jgi:uncharacterized coiled-coil protein SlyX